MRRRIEDTPMESSHLNLPKSIQALRHYSMQFFLQDLMAGVTVGLVALPLAMAFGIASNVTPQAGLYTAVVAGFLISALGGSRTQIGGPTGAFVVIVAGIVARFGMSGLAMVTLMAGVLLVAMGLTGLGSAVRFIPRMVVVGFTNGIAVLIASTQIKDFFGLRTGAVPSEFLPRMRVLLEHASTVPIIQAVCIQRMRSWCSRRVSRMLIAVVLWSCCSRRRSSSACIHAARLSDRVCAGSMGGMAAMAAACGAGSVARVVFCIRASTAEAMSSLQAKIAVGRSESVSSFSPEIRPEA